jgi:hypothetical protein
MEQLQVAAICGRSDRYSTLCHRNPWNGLPLYIPTYCFLLNHSAFEILAGLSVLAQGDGLSHEIGVNDPEWGSRLPANFREFLRAFVRYGHPDFVWPGLQRYAIDSKLLGVKARCIYFEHRLSREVAKHGCVVPTNARTLPRWRLYLAEKLAGFAYSLRSHAKKAGK